ncbi:class I SAM-dependent methyltransferase [candidate division KSB1 bacterium]|nr:class I SAM-dependent methyltransferase [candidate division KSB1 bacterium]
MSFLKSYAKNFMAILSSYNNPLKKVENISQKDELEKAFYNEEAEKYLENFDIDLFLYDENEKFPASHRYFYSLLQDIKDKRILDCCCGYGFSSVKCAKGGAYVTGIDISPRMIELSQKNADFNHVSDKTDFRIMSAQQMEFENDSFDYVIGMGALHHLNLELAGNEIKRVLKKGGRAIFIEPRIPFKWLIFLRSVIPTKCLESPGGAQLSDREIKLFSRKFSQIHIEYFIFLNKLSRLPLFNKISDKLEQVDIYLSKKCKYLKKLYWAWVLVFIK